ncbi:MAG: hypothetical protein M3430_04635 [Acidobacteriota bacterium]|nr:hypothetical protein [Acidobacteriota bacterium]
MFFFYNGKKYAGASAVEIVRQMEHDAKDYPRQGTLRDFLRWTYVRLADHVPKRELDMPSHLADETLAFSFLCLLDEYGIGRLPVPHETGT